HRVIEVNELGAIVEFQFGKRERKATASQQRGKQALTAESCELLDQRGKRLIGEIQTAVEIGIIVPTLALVRAWKPERAIRLRVTSALVPREASVEDHASGPTRYANESDRSARIARISSSARPRRIRSTGRRSPRDGLIPNSHEIAASRSYKRRRFDQTSSSRSTFSALSGSMPAPRSQRITCERLTPKRSASCAAERKSARSTSTLCATATGMIH